MNTKKKNYIEGLDAMRGIAILGVVFYHLIPGKFPGGFLGVNMFFVLSGYLIYKGAEWEVTNGKYSVQKFYMKRIKICFIPLQQVLPAEMPPARGTPGSPWLNTARFGRAAHSAAPPP